MKSPRSFFRRVLRRAMFAMMGIVAVYLAFAAYLWTQQPVISFDGLARIRELLPKVEREEDRAWPQYRAALVAAGLAHPGEGVAQVEQPFQKAPDPGWPEWAQTREWLQCHSAQVAAIREAAALPVMGVGLGSPLPQDDAALYGQAAVDESNEPPSADELVFPVMNILLPHLAYMRRIGQVLSADMMGAVEDDQSSRAAADFVALMRLSAHAQEGRFLINDLIGISVRNLGCRGLIMALEWKPEAFSDADLAVMQSAIAAIDPALQQMTLAAEAVMFEDIVQRMYSDNGSGDGWYLPSARATQQFEMLSAMGGDLPPRTLSEQAYAAAASLLAPVGALAVAGRRDTMDFYRDWRTHSEAHAALPLHAQGELYSGYEEFPSTRWKLPSLLMPAIGSFGRAVATDRAECLGALVAVACVRYRLARGAWPKLLEDLAPVYLSTEPIDTWSGKPLLLAGDGPGFRVWSVGRNEVDDHGDPATWGTDEPAAWRKSTQIGRLGPGDSGPPLSDWIIFAPRGNTDRWVKQGG